MPSKFFLISLFYLCISLQMMHGQNREKLQEILETLYPEHEPGAAALIIHNDSVLLREGFGRANLKSQEKITPETHFRMASVSKQFTAQAILQLQGKGIINVEDPVSNYLTLPDFAKAITIDQLMSHTSGIADYEPLIPGTQEKQITDAEVLRLIRHSDSLYFKPASDFHYSNTGFCLLTQVVEKAITAPYRSFIKNTVFDVSNMPTTQVYEKGKEIEQRAYGYHFNNKENQWDFADQSLTSATMGDGSVYTSINEYEHWIKTIWSQDDLEKQENPFYTHTNITHGLSYGYGWFVGEEKDGSKAYFHSGETIGFHNMVYHNPSKKTLIVLFTNADDQRIGSAFNQISKALDIHLKKIPSNKNLFKVLSEVYENKRH